MHTLPRLIDEVRKLHNGISLPAEVQMHFFTPVCRLYPPSSVFQWWNGAEKEAAVECAAIMEQFKSAMWNLVDAHTKLGILQTSATHKLEKGIRYERTKRRGQLISKPIQPNNRLHSSFPFVGASCSPACASHSASAHCLSLMQAWARLL